MELVERSATFFSLHMYGSSFARWPQEMRMITPSFHANPFLQTDLNAIHPHSSPADLHGCEHPSGAQYAAYLQAAVRFSSCAHDRNYRIRFIRQT